MDSSASPVVHRISPRLIAAVFAIIFLVLAAAYWLFLRPDYAPAFTGLRPADASAVVVELKEKGIPHRLQDGGTTVLVPTDEVDPARVAIAGSEVQLKGGVGFELFNKSDMGLTDFAQRINYQRALQGELERTIMMLDGVDSARVHLAMPERSLFRSDRSGAKAAVELVGTGGRQFDEARVAGIQRLVAFSVPDLTPADVVVLDADGRVLSAAGTTNAFLTPEAEERQAVSSYYRARARAAIAQTLPGLRADVHVLVDSSTAGLPEASMDDAGTASTGNASSASGGARSSPARTFGLRITVGTPAPLNAEDRANVQAALRAAVGYDERLRDSLSFETGVADRDGMLTVGDRAPLPATAAAAAATAATEPSPLPLWVYGLFAILALMAIAASLIVRRSAAPALSDAERSEIVARLKAALRDQEAVRAS